MRYRGHAAHASAFPWKGINALDAMARAHRPHVRSAGRHRVYGRAQVTLYNGVSMMRQQMMPSWRVRTWALVSGPHVSRGRALAARGQVHGVITNGGAKPNIIPALTEAEYYLRTPQVCGARVFCSLSVSATAELAQEAALGELRNRFRRQCEAAAAAHGCQAEVVERDKPYADIATNGPMVRSLLVWYGR